jgi:hypothetical protein
MASICSKDAENVYAPLVMVSIWGRKRTLSDYTVYQNGSIDTSFDPPLFSLDLTFKLVLIMTVVMCIYKKFNSDLICFLINLSIFVSTVSF